MKAIARVDAIREISEIELSNLKVKARESLALVWWGIDEEDSEFHELSEEMQAALLSEDIWCLLSSARERQTAANN